MHPSVGEAIAAVVPGRSTLRVIHKVASLELEKSSSPVAFVLPQSGNPEELTGKDPAPGGAAGDHIDDGLVDVSVDAEGDSSGLGSRGDRGQQTGILAILCDLSGVLRLSEDGEHDGGDNGDDQDDRQQFHQTEALIGRFSPVESQQTTG